MAKKKPRPPEFKRGTVVRVGGEDGILRVVSHVAPGGTGPRKGDVALTDKPDQYCDPAMLTVAAEPPGDMLQLVTLLVSFIDCIEVTGGVDVVGGVACPRGDESWSDLGELYLGACAALRLKPLTEIEEAEED
jgi:hypothetical protein